MQLGYPYHERLEALDNATPNGEPDKKYEFQGVRMRFQQFRIPIGLPRYRLNNGRTGAAQAEYITLNDLEQDFFSADSEQDHVQQAQHEILSEMTAGAGLSDLFEDVTTRQDEPLILTHDGRVANGNRRLATMRNLVENDAATYAHFTHVDIIRLPEAEEKDIVRLEANLQLIKDVKEDYGWVSKILMLRKAVDSGIKMKEAAALYEFNSEKEARTKGIILEIAESYLDSRGKSMQYSVVAEDEFAFMEMEKLVKHQKTWPVEKRIKFQELCFACIDDSSRLGGRVMGQIRDIHNKIDVIIEEVEQDHAGSIIEEEESDEISEDMELMGGASNSNGDDASWKRIPKTDEGDDLMETVRNTIQREKAKDKAEKTDKFVFSQIKEVEKILQNAVKNKQSSMSKEGVMERIVSVEQKLRDLKEWVKND
ncbi:MAG: hypothetical protein CL409_00020 [Acidimicrobiaceae bacterium]|nr:hypothetical protein [Acidimicrobiaceae bacterium]